MMDEKWIVWTLASIFKHFSDLSNFYVPTKEVGPDKQVDRYELMFAGPDFNIVDRSATNIDIVLNLLVISNQQPNDLYFHYLNIGKGLVKFSNCIPVKKYGTNDDKSQVTTLDLKSKIVVTDILPFDPVSRLQRSTIEAKYQAIFIQ